MAACVIAVLAGVAWTLTRDVPAVAGYNGVRPGAFVGAVAPKRRLCQSLGSASRPVNAALITVGAGPAGPQRLEVTVPDKPGRTILRGYRDGVLKVPLPDGTEGRLCLRNLGRKPVQLAGEPFASATIDGRPARFAVAITLVSAQRPSWASRAGGVLRRVGLARAGAGGSATGWFAATLLVVAFGGALAAAWRWGR